MALNCTTEANQQIIKEFVFMNDHFSFVNLSRLEQHFHTGRLQGAVTFALLFNFTLPEDMAIQYCFKKGRLMENEEHQVTLCNDLHILYSEWTELMKFIRCGYSGRLDVLFNVSDKLGGIPSVDVYYENAKMREFKASGVMYQNPMTPPHDIYRQFHWISVHDSNSLPGNGFEVTVPSSQYHKYYRKPRAVNGASVPQ